MVAQRRWVCNGLGQATEFGFEYLHRPRGMAEREVVTTCEMARRREWRHGSALSNLFGPALLEVLNERTVSWALL